MSTMQRSVSGMSRAVLLHVWLLVVLVVLWWVLSASSVSPFFPALQNILDRFGEVWLSAEGLGHVRSSATTFVVGFLAAVVIGVSAGAMLWRWPRVNLSLTWTIYFLYVLPTAALLPVLVTVLGIGLKLKIAVVVLAAVWPTLLNTLDGMRSVDQTKLDTAASLRMGELQKVFLVVLPNALPQVMAGMRHSLQIAVIMIVVSEMTASTSGIGFQLLKFQHTFALTDMWTGILLLSILGLTASMAFSAFEYWLLRWYRGQKKGAKA